MRTSRSSPEPIRAPGLPRRGLEPSAGGPTKKPARPPKGRAGCFVLLDAGYFFTRVKVASKARTGSCVPAI